MLIEKDRALRRAAARALGRIGPKAKPAVPALAKLLKDGDVLLRWSTAKALGEIDPAAPTAAAVLAEALKDKNREVREAAASALGKTIPGMKATELEAKKIKALIADLAKIDEPDMGFSPTMGGTGFAPIESSVDYQALIFGAAATNRNEAFTALVELGPMALPFLLESLDDKTPTKLDMAHGFGFGCMWLAHEICGNPLNPREIKVLPDVDGPSDSSWWDVEEGEIGRYTVTVGDICFVAIGQITNRSYQAVRYQPTGCVVVNSTVQDKKLASEVRAIWGTSDYRQELLDSLLLDLQTRHYGYSQSGAAMRLVYYFPGTAEDLIISRLDELESAEVSATPMVDRGGVADMVSHILWSKSPKLCAKVLEIFGRTTDTETLLAIMPTLGKEHDELVFQRLTAQLDAWPQDRRDSIFEARVCWSHWEIVFPSAPRKCFANS